MKTYTKRALSWVLAMALLITCTVSGLVLPSSAAPSTAPWVYTQDFEGEVREWRVGAAAAVPQAEADGIDNKVIKLPSSVYTKAYVTLDNKLEAGKQYLFRVMAKNLTGTATRLYFNTPTGGNNNIENITDTDWVGYQFLFKCSTTDLDGFEVAFASDAAEMLIDNVEFCEIHPELNIAQNGDMEGKSYAFVKGYDNGWVHEKDGDNYVLKAPSGTTKKYLQMYGMTHPAVYEISFDYKGPAISPYWTTGTKLWESSKTASTTWKKYTMIYHTTTSSTAGRVMLSNSNTTKDLFIDNFSIRKLEMSLTGDSDVLVGNTVTLTPALAPADTVLLEKKTPTWTSSNEAVATVNSGVVTGVAVGTATITAKLGALEATFEVTVKDPASAPALTEIKLDKTEVALVAGETETVTATAVPDGANMAGLTWTSDNEAVATVADGIITAVKGGTATITAAVGEIKATCTVTVENVNLFVNGDFEQGASVNWGNESHVQEGVGKDGTAGAKITSTVDENTTTHQQIGFYYKAALISKLKPDTVYKLTFDYKHEGKGFGMVYLNKSFGTVSGTTKDFYQAQSLTSGDVDWKTVTYTFFTPSTALSASGGYEFLIRQVQYNQAGNEGTGAAYFDNFKLVEVGAVQPAAPTLTEITLDKTTADLTVGATVTLAATAVPNGADISALEWSSDKETVATVANGVVTAVAAGTATITAKVGDITATCVVTVTDPNARPTTPTDPNALIVNGDFEADASIGWNNDSDIQAGVGKDGSWGIAYNYTHDGNGNKVFAVSYDDTNLKNLKPNTKYTLSFDYKSSGAGFAQLYCYTDVFTDLVFNTSKSLPDSSDWTTYTLTVTTKDTLPTTFGGTTFMFRYVMYGDASGVGTGSAAYDNIKLTEIPVATSIELDKASVSVKQGKTYTLLVNVKPDGATMPAITWSSDNEAVATVADGVVTGVAAGTATITATAGALTATCAVTVVADDGNLIENGDFEQGPSVGWQNDSDVQAGVGKDGSWGIAYNYTHDGNGNKTFSVNYDDTNLKNLKPNTKYMLTFDYKSSGAGFAQLYNYIDFSVDFTRGKSISLPDSADWTTYTYYFTTKATLPTSWNKMAFMFRYIMYGDASGVGTGSAAYDNIKLIEVPVATEIILDKETASVKEGKTFTLSVSTIPEIATKPVITWTSSNEAVATVVDGVVTGVAAGTATITATAGALSDTCVVTIVPDDGNLIENGDFEQGGSVAWGGSSYVQAGVGKDGSFGVKITSKVDENTTSHQQPGFYYKDALVGKLEPDAVYQLTFDYKHEGKGFGMIYLNKSFGTLDGTTKNFYQAQNLSSGDVDWKTVTYTFFTPSAALSKDSGSEFLLRQVQYNQAGNEGTGTTYFDNFKLVKVRDVVHADEIYLAPSALELLPKASGELKVMTKPEGAATGILTWESSDPTVATVDKNGKVTALVDSGEVTITVKNDKGKVVTAKVTITENAELLKNGDFEQGGLNWKDNPAIKAGIGKDGGYGLEMMKKGSAYYYGSALKLTPATTYIFSFEYLLPKGSDFRVWSDTDFGLTLTKISGNANEWKKKEVIFTTAPNLSLSSGWDLCFVCDSLGNQSNAIIDNVSLRKYSSGVSATELTLSKAALSLIPGRTGSLTAFAKPENADLNGVKWSSSNENVATVEYGVVTAVGKGTAIITAETPNGKKANCEVTVSGDEAPVKNGTFDIANDTSWELKDGATIEAAAGRMESAALKLPKGASAVQTVTGLKGETPYQLTLSYRTQSGAMNITLIDKNGKELYKGKTSTGTSFKKQTVEFTTPADVTSEAILTLTPAGNGPVYVDNVYINVKASLVDFIVSDLFWVGGGSQVTPGTKLQFGVTVTNQGEDPVPKGKIVVVELRKNGKAFMTLEHTLEDDLPSNGSVIFATGDDELWPADEGHWVISARANPTLSILEMVDTNNTTQKNLRVDNNIVTAPQPALDANMTELTFSDEFDSLDSIDQYATGADGYKWYVTRNYGAGTVQPDYYSIEDGIIKLKAKVPGFNITLSTIDVDTHVGYLWNLGYLEVRFCIPNADPGKSGVDYKGSPAIWSFPDTKWLELPGRNKQWVEMDWMEYWGITSARPGGYYTISYHDQSQGEPGVDDHHYTNSNSYMEGLGDEQWHTMGWLWAENAVITYLDGKEVHHIYYGKDRKPSCKVTLHNSVDTDTTGAYTLMNEQFNALFIGGSEKFPMLVDYVHIWQGGDGKIDIPDEDDGSGNNNNNVVGVTVNSEEFWSYYGTDDYGEPVMEITEENYEWILSAKELWDQLSVANKEEINALFAANGQPTFDELLAAAQAFADGLNTPDDGDTPEGDGEDSPETGATTALPMAVALVAVGGFAVMLKARKRKEQD